MTNYGDSCADFPSGDYGSLRFEASLKPSPRSVGYPPIAASLASPRRAPARVACPAPGPPLRAVSRAEQNPVGFLSKFVHWPADIAERAAAIRQQVARALVESSASFRGSAFTAWNNSPPPCHPPAYESEHRLLPCQQRRRPSP